MRLMIVLLVLFGAAACECVGDGVVCTSQRILGEFRAHGEGNGHRHGSLYFLAAQLSGLQIYDVSDPAQVVEVLHTGSSAGLYYDVYADDSTMYLVGSGHRLEIYNIDDPANPVLLSNDAIPVGPLTQEISIIDDIAYIAAGYAVSGGRLYIVDVSDPAEPKLLSETVLSAQSWSLDYVDGYVYMSVLDEIAVFDVRDPTSPVHVSSYQLQENLYNLAADERGVYAVNTSFELLVFDHADPSDLQLRSTTRVNFAYDLDVDSNKVFVACRDEGICIFDVSDLSEPREVLRLPTGWDASYCYADQGFLHYAHNTVSQVIFDTSESFSTVVVDRDDTPRYSRDSVVIGEHLYIANIDSIEIFDIAEPHDPVHVGSYAEDMFDVEQVWEHEGYLASTEIRGGFKLYDVSSPDNPIRVSWYDPYNPLQWHPMTDAYIRGHYTYMLYSRYGMITFHDGHHQFPFEADRQVTGTNMNSMAGSGDMLYVANGSEPLLVYSLSQPSAPALINEIDVPEAVEVMEVYGDHLYLGTVAGVRVYSLEEVMIPELVGFVGTPNDQHAIPHYLAFQQQRLYVTDRAGSLSVYDISEPEQIHLVGMTQGLKSANGFYPHGEVGYLTSEYDGVFTLDLDESCVGCQADFTGDRQLDFMDVSVFVSLFSGTDAAADWNGDGEWDFFDVSGFLEDYLAGCP